MHFQLLPVISDKIVIIGAVVILSMTSMLFGYYSDSHPMGADTSDKYIISGINDNEHAKLVALMLQR
jgi:hypothetical protein